MSFPAGVEQREVLLVLPHREDEAFLRHGEELALEAARVHRGHLDERRHLVEERRVLALGAERGSLARGGRLAGPRG